MKNPKFFRISIIVFCFINSLFLIGTIVDADDAPKNEKSTTPKESETFVAMRELARETKVEILDDDGNVLIEAVLVEQPIIRYGDQTRAINDSTMWVWVDSQKSIGADQKSGGKKTAPQPVFFQKIEVF